VADAGLVIAHNAYFDRAMVERHWNCFAEKPWACTLNSVDWLREGFSAGKLDYLGMQFGWFCGAGYCSKWRFGRPFLNAAVGGIT
jgi:DNA polymerase-3 subunit epsilon